MWNADARRRELKGLCSSVHTIATCRHTKSARFVEGTPNQHAKPSTFGVPDCCSPSETQEFRKDPPLKIVVVSVSSGLCAHHRGLTAHQTRTFRGRHTKSARFMDTSARPHSGGKMSFFRSVSQAVNFWRTRLLETPPPRTLQKAYA